jgi:hypothetical protein
MKRAGTFVVVGLGFGVLGLVAILSTVVIVGTRKKCSPALTVDPRVIDLGVLQLPNSTVPERVAFTIRNTGSGVLHITGIRASCPCLNPQLSTEDICPGDSAQLTVHPGVPVKVGPLRYEMFLLSDDPAQPVCQLQVKGMIDRPCYAVPESLSVEGLRSGEERRVEVEVVGPVGEADFGIAMVSAKSDQVVVREKKRIRAMPATQRQVWNISLAVRPRGDDKWEDTLVVATSSAKYPVLSVRMKVRELPPLRLEPAVVLVRSDDGLEPTVMDVKVIQTGSVPVKITDVQAPQGVAVRIESDGLGLPTVLHVTIRRPANSLVRSAEAIILRLDGNAREFQLPFVAVGDVRSQGGACLADRMNRQWTRA